MRILPVGEFQGEALRRLSNDPFVIDRTAPEVLLLARPWPVVKPPPSVRVVACPCTSSFSVPGCEVLTLAGDSVLEEITPTAEHVFGLLWAIQRNGDRALSWDEWDREEYIADHMWSRMKFAVIGFGRLGKKVSRMASAMGFRISTPHEADVISLHADRNPSSEGMICTEWLAGMKEGAYLVNTAFGEMVDDEAVLSALSRGKLKGYAADVLSGEYERDFDVEEHPLVRGRMLHNIVLTPHIGGSTHDAREMTQLRILEKIIDRHTCPQGREEQGPLEA